MLKKLVAITDSSIIFLETMFFMNTGGTDLLL